MIQKLGSIDQDAEAIEHELHIDPNYIGENVEFDDYKTLPPDTVNKWKHACGDKVNVLKFDLKKILSWEHEHIAQRTDNLLNVRRNTKDLRPLKYQLPEMSTEEVELKLDRMRLDDSKLSVLL